MKRALKSTYVNVMHRIGGLVGDATPARENRLKHWAASLPAIYDIDRLVALDVPWWTYDAIDWVENFLATRNHPEVFEWGSGASSVWLAKRAARVTSIEHDGGWLPIVRDRLGAYGHAEVRAVPADAAPVTDPLYLSHKEGYGGVTFEAYAKAIEADERQYDLIVIDGRVRAACFAHAKDRLKPGGAIVFDNTKRQRYAKPIRASGLPYREFSGLTPSLPHPDRTTIVRPEGFAA